jgi:dihydrofolate reductase
MTPPRISIIAAVARNGVIGRDNRLPWHLPEDLKRFRALTMGHHVIMGRKTWESIGRVLPGRTMVVVSRDPGYGVPGCLIAHSLEEALGLCGDDPEVFVIGGAEIYRQALPMAGRLYLTRIEQDVAGDTCFPSFDMTEWSETSRGPVTGAGFPASFVVLDRRSP